MQRILRSQYALMRNETSSFLEKLHETCAYQINIASWPATA
jgi:hypothetical protein